MSELVAVQGMTLVVKESGTSATLTPTTPPDSKVKAESKAVYAGDVAVSIVGATNGTCTQSAPATATLSPTATKSKASSKEVLRENDESNTAVVTGALSGGGACTLNVTAVVDSAGQTKVKAK